MCRPITKLSHINLIDYLPKINIYLTFHFVTLLSSECVSRGSGGASWTVGELVPSLFTAPRRKELLMLAGDVELNPGPYTRYTRACKDLYMVLMHKPTSSYLLKSKCNYHEITSSGTSLSKSIS